MRYSKEDIERANAQNIVDVAEKLGIAMKRQGTRYMALCLWHTENTPSMQIGGRYNNCRCYACGESHGVIDLVMKERNCNFKDAMDWLNNKYPSIKTIELKEHKNKPVEKNILNFNMAYVDAHVSIDNALSKCLLYCFPREVVERVTQMYRLGHDERMLHYEHTWFPSIDSQGRVRNIKVQGYCTNPDVPQFGHCNRKETCWLGNMLKTTEEGEFDNECLFQPQTLSNSPLKGENIVLVESPKNAVVGACWTMTYRPELDVTWVAVGNKNMLKRSVLEPLRGKKVIVIPDRDAVDEWKAKIATMRDIATFVFSSFCDSTDDPENKKLDIADLLLKAPTEEQKR